MINRPIHEALEDDHQLRMYGYQVLRVGSSAAFSSFKSLFSDYLHEAMTTQVSIGVSDSDFQIEYYHEHLQEYSLDHHEFIKKCGRVLPGDFTRHPFVNRIREVASACTGYDLKLFMDKIEFRVVRPHQSDNNPFHRDHWFPYFIPLLNIYAPLSGNYHDSAMPIIPRSHLWSDEDVVPTFTYDDIKAGRKSLKNGVAYSVPEVAKCKHTLHPHRPDIMLGDVMCFSPLMVHGAGSNTSPHTRFSLELRLERI